MVDMQKKPSLLNSIIESLKTAFGESRIKKTAHHIVLKFNLSDSLQMEQANYFAKCAHKENIVFSIPKETLTDTLLVIQIPIQQNLPNLLLIARSMEGTQQKLGGEIYRPITELDPEFILEEITETPWRRVIGAPYEKPVIEAVVERPIDREKSIRQETSIGNVLHPEDRALVNVRNWLHHQERVEAQSGETRTVLPENWVSTAGLDRAQQFKYSGESLRKKLINVFRSR